MVVHIEDEVLAHDGEADQADISLRCGIRHKFWSNEGWLAGLRISSQPPWNGKPFRPVASRCVDGRYWPMCVIDRPGLPGICSTLGNYFATLVGMSKQLDPCWQKARIAARIIVKSRKATLHARDRRLARWLADQPGVTNRLIEQGVAYVVAPVRLIHHEWVDKRLAA
jgi:hypothetical protein